MFDTIMPQKRKAVALFVVLAFAVAGLTASPIAFAAQHENMTMTMDENMSSMGNMTGGNATSMTENMTETESMNTTVTSLSDSPVVAQGPGNVSDPSVLAQLSGLDRHPHLTPGNVSDPSVVAQGQGNNPLDCFKSNVTIDICPMHSHFKGLENNSTDCFEIVGEAKVSTGEVGNWTGSVQSFFSLLPANNQITTINVNLAGGSGPITDMQGVWNLMENGNMTANDRQQVLDEVNSLLAAAKPGFTQAQLDALTFCIISEANALGPTPNY